MSPSPLGPTGGPVRCNVVYAELLCCWSCRVPAGGETMTVSNSTPEGRSGRSKRRDPDRAMVTCKAETRAAVIVLVAACNVTMMINVLKDGRGRGSEAEAQKRMERSIHRRKKEKKVQKGYPHLHRRNHLNHHTAVSEPKWRKPRRGSVSFRPWKIFINQHHK